MAFTSTRELLIGEVLAVHAREGLTEPSTLYTDPQAYRPIGRLADSAYCRQGAVFEMKRQSYRQWLAARRVSSS